MRDGGLAGPHFSRFVVVADEKADFRIHNLSFISQSGVNLKHAKYSAPLIMAMAEANLDVVFFVLTKPARQRKDRVSGLFDPPGAEQPLQLYSRGRHPCCGWAALC
jgi:hypothetical protein